MLKLYIFLVILVYKAEATNPDNDSAPMILVNNMELPSIRTGLSAKYIDFIAEYQYADGDIVHVTCANFLNKESTLTMEYELAGRMSDKSLMKDLSARKSIGFVTKLHSGHNNNYMVCTNKEGNNYTKTMVRFVKRTKFSIITVKINGINIRPKPINDIQRNHYHIEYKYGGHQHINVTCEVEQADVKLSVTDDDFVRPRSEVSSYKRTELTNKQIVMDFSLSSPNDRTLVCLAEYPNGTNAELVSMRFTAGNFPIDQLPLHLKLLTNSPMLELYSDNQLKIIIYEFDDGETLNLTCGTLRRLQPGPAVYLELKDSDSERCETNGCNVSKTLHVSGKNDNTEIVCYLKEAGDPANPSGADISHREIRVVLREKGPY